MHPIVVWAQVFAGNQTFRNALNSNAVLGARPSPCIPVLPLAYLGIGLRADPFTQLRNAHCAQARKVLIQLHKTGVYSICYRIAIAFALVASAIFRS